MSEIRLSAIWIYPVKSLAGVSVPAARVDDRGLVGDRRFMIVDADDRFVTQRERAELARLSAHIEHGALRLVDGGGDVLEVDLDVDEGERTVRVWRDDVRARDAGDGAARWLSTRLATPLRLVRMPATSRRPADPRYAREGDLTSFADGFPFLLVGQRSVDAVAARVTEGPAIDVRRFRPNLVVDGAPAFAEDEWPTLDIGDVTFHAPKGCSRCLVVNVDPDRGERTTEPLRALAGLRRWDGQVWFGQNLVHDGPGMLRVGDPVRIRSA